MVSIIQFPMPPVQSLSKTQYELTCDEKDRKEELGKCLDLFRRRS